MKLRHYIIVLSGLLFAPILAGQDFNYSDVPSLSLGQIKSTERNIYSIMSNPAGLTAVSSPGLAFTYIAPYNIHKLSNRSVNGVLPTRYGSFSFLFTQAGCSLSLLNRYGLAYAREFGDHVSASLMFNGITHKLNGTDTYGGFFSVIGIQIFPSGKVNIGFYVQNIEQSKISYPDSKVVIPVLYAAGVSWQPIKGLSLKAEMEKDQQFSPQYKFGMKYSPLEILTLRGGIKGSPVEISFGTGITWRFTTIDIGIAYHQQLGVTSGASLSFLLLKKKKVQDK